MSDTSPRLHVPRVGTTVGEVLWQLIRHPVHHLIRHWNWKTAVLSAIVRGTIFFTTNLPAGLGSATLALGVDVPLRLSTSGFYGAITQAFRRAQPAWAATVVVLLLLPMVAHTIEFLVHWLGGTPFLRTSILVSVSLSAVSALTNLFLMRRGILVVGDASRTLWEDLRQAAAAIRELVVESARRLRRMISAGSPG